jgi:hypothetical protein
MAMNRLGYNYYPDDRHYTTKDLAAWLPALGTLGAGWLTLRGSVSRAIPEPFIRGLLEAGIAPIVSLPIRMTTVRPSDLTGMLEAYAHWGVRHVVIGDRPNTRAQWEPAEWGRSALVERYLDRLIPLLQAQRSAGLQPVLPPLEPGGDYWDTAFLASSLTALVRRGQQSLVRDLALGIYAWAHSRPLDWGRGGPKAWPSVRPYQASTDAQDQRGFRIFDWYSQIALDTLGRSLPMIAVSAGVGASWDPEAEDDVATVASMVRAVAAAEVPDSVLAVNLHLLCADADSPDYPSALYADPNSPRAAARALLALGAQPTYSPAPAAEKTIGHYLLLPTNGTLGLEAWNSLAEYVLVWRPVIGFSATEASLASEVTLVGDTRALPVSLENELRAAGCTVRRVIPEKARAPGVRTPVPTPGPQSHLVAGVSHG